MTRLLLLAAFILAGCSTGTNSRRPAADNDSQAQAELDQTAQGIGDLFEGIITQRHPGNGPGVDRPVFVKTHGCAKGTLTVAKDLPDTFKQGLFAAPVSRQVWVRFSSDTIKTTPDNKRSTIGFSLKVLNVPGRKVLAGEEDSTSQDFLLQNHNVFFTDNALEFLQLFDGKHPGFGDKPLKGGQSANQILSDMEHDVENLLGINFWSTLPYGFGDKDFVKYKVIPCTEGIKPEAIAQDPYYLRKRLERDFKEKRAKPICFQLQAQLRKGDMPLDEATVEWSETESVPQTVATITLPAQNIAANTKTCETFSFTAWHALVAHKPVGSISYARGKVYKRLADLRRGRDHFPMTEPTSTLAAPSAKAKGR